MASNKFATMLHRNTHRGAVILVYTLLEWILISLLLLNALFSFLIAKFASYFGLKPPCLFCSRIDHLFEPGKGRKSYRDLVCDTHAAEISQLGYCSNHRMLAEASGMCEDCLSSRPLPPESERTVALFSWMKTENDEKDLRCSCCDVSLESGFYSPFLFLKPSWGVLEYTQKGDLVKEMTAEGEMKEGLKDDEIPKAVRVGDDQLLSLVCADEVLEKEEEVKDDEVEGEEEVKDEDGAGEVDDEAGALMPKQEVTVAIQSNDLYFKENDASFKILSLEHDYIPIEERLVPGELIDSTTLKSLDSRMLIGKDDEEFGEHVVEMLGSIVNIGSDFEINEALISTVEITDRTCFPVPETMYKTEQCSSTPASDESSGVSCDYQTDKPQEIKINPLEESIEDSFDHLNFIPQATSITPPKESNGDTCDTQAFNPQASPIIPPGSSDEVEVVTGKEDYDHQASEEDSKMMDTEANCEISIGSEICDQEHIDQAQLHEPIPPLVCLHDQSSENNNEAIKESQVMEIEPVKTTNLDLNHHFSICPEHNEVEAICPKHNEVEEERPPGTPTYVDGLHNLHKGFLFERREYGTESLDGSVVSEIDGGDVLTVDQFKAALKAKRKALSALYAELEEERSASAIAANQTMAMITRLQQEKSAMQMEALQYQRMMEEQSEYDQEALQLLNELMMKREKEKQELEKELEVYRKKVILYEAKERRNMKRNKASGRSGTSSASSSAEDSDDLSIELNEGDENFYGLNESNQNTPADAVLSSGTDQEASKHLITLDESLADFEEERLSILEQLKALEEKLFTLDDEESPVHTESPEHFSDDNGHGFDENCEFSDNDVNGFANFFMDDIDSNGKHESESRNIGSRGKRLLPLFDAISTENEDGLIRKQEMANVSQDSASKFSSEQKKLAIAVEVDNVYERLQALEADREFLKHCISSLKKGDKGMDLLQEIVQHLRDLKNVELRVRNAGDVLASLSA